MIEAKELRKLLRYEPDTGKLYWLPRDHIASKAWNTRYAGKEAFTALGSHGYRHGAVFDRNYLAHRVVWALVHGAWPRHQIDHINGDKTDNRMVNLRQVSHAENTRNCAKPYTNTSGTVGVYWSARWGLWTAEIHFNKRKIYLGSFRRIEDAIAARKAAEHKYGYHGNHGRLPIIGKSAA